MSEYRRTTVLILAGGSVRAKLNFLKSGCECPALIPVNTRPVILYICEFYSAFPDIRMYLAVNEAYKPVIEREIATLEPGMTIISMPETANVNQSLAYSLDRIPENDSVIVNLVTTIPVHRPKLNEVLIDNENNVSLGWSGVVLDGSEPRMISKNENSTLESHAFTGVFHAERESLRDSIDTESTDLLDVVSTLSEKQNLTFIKTEWIDCGHELNYYKAKTRLLNSRRFNAISIDSHNLVTKRSTDVDKVRNEYLFIKMLPPQLSYYFPRVTGEFASNGGIGAYTTEFYGYPNMAELCLYWDLDDNNWMRIFSQLAAHLKIFRSYRYSIGINAHLEFYTERFFKRYEAFRSQLMREENNDWIDHELVINDLECRPLIELSTEISDRFESLYDEDHFCITHGDYCFSNILYDIPSGIIKYIDPRGSFGVRCAGIYGDQKYDIAKLAHSATGCYDYIVNNLYQYSEDGNNISYRFNLRKNYTAITANMEKLVDKLGYSRNEILFLMGTLFISMTPLHDDSRMKQKLLYLHGLKILNEVLLGNENMYRS